MATISLDINDLPYRVEKACVAGDTFPLLLQLQINSSAVDLTNCTLALDGTNPDETGMVGRNITPSAAATGLFDGGLTSAETAVSTGKLTYQVECTFPVGDANFSAGAVRTLLEVVLNIKGDLA